MKKASDILKEAASVIEERGKLRDKDDGERSMSRAVEAYTTLCGNVMENELQGWLFMICLKMARATAGKTHLDDLTDLCGYGALAAEYVSNETSQFWVEHALENGVNLRTQDEIDAYAKKTEGVWEDRKKALDELSREGQDLKVWDTVREDRPFEAAYSHTIVPSGNESESECCETTEQSETEANVWIKWEGGECPVDLDVMVQVQFRCEAVPPKQKGSLAGDWYWEHNLREDLQDGDIIAYRVVK